MDLSEGDDEVVEEMDVFLSKELSQNLYLLQYPTLHLNQTFSADQRLIARVKPQHKKLEMDVMLDISSPNYDQSKGEQIAINVDGGGTGDGLTYENSVMDFQTLSSKLIPQKGKRFAAAIVQDGQLHLTPIAHVMQMQPSFKYRDCAEKRAMHAAKMKAQNESGHSSQDEADEAKAVTIRFKSVESEATRAMRENSYASYEKRLYQEKWISASVHHRDHAYTDRERNRLFCNQAFSPLDDAGDYPEMEVNSSSYLQALVPNYVVSDVDSGIGPENVLSISKLKFLPLGEQLKLLMKSAKIMHFSHLLTLLPSNPDANAVVRSLQSYAVLVKGCWIVKSEVLFPPDTVSPISGTPADLICKVRDYILCLFTKQAYLVRREITKQVNVSSDEVKSILEQISKMKVGHGWSLKLPCDQEFIEKYPEVHERQAMVWNNRCKQLSKRFQEEETSESCGKSSTSKPKSANKNVKTSPHSKRAKKSSQSKTKPEMSEKELNGLKNFLSPPRPVNNNVIVDHAVADITEQSPIDVNQPYSIQTSDVPQSNTVHLQDTNDLIPLRSTVPLPFVRPSAVGVATAEPPFNSFTEQHELKPASLDTKVECDNAVTFSAEGVNMDNVHATVALVTDQMRQQAVLENNVFNSSESSR